MHSICWVKHIRADKTTSLGKFFKECYKMKAEVSHFTILKSRYNTVRKICVAWLPLNEQLLLV